MRSDSRLYLNLFLAITIGILFGVFTLNKFLSSDSPLMPVGGQASDTVYLLHVGSYDQEIPANLAISELYDLDTFSLIVKESTQYNIYVDIARNQEDLTMKKNYLESNGIECTIKTKSLYSLLSFLESDSDEYNFWYQSINYYLLLLDHKQVAFSDEYVESVTDSKLSFYSSINGLNTNISNRNINSKFKLYTYRNLVESLT